MDKWYFKIWEIALAVKVTQQKRFEKPQWRIHLLCTYYHLLTEVCDHSNLYWAWNTVSSLFQIFRLEVALSLKCVFSTQNRVVLNTEGFQNDWENLLQNKFGGTMDRKIRCHFPWRVVIAAICIRMNLHCITETFLCKTDL